MPSHWRTNFLSRNQRSALRARKAPLFQYRCTDAEFSELTERLATAARLAPIPEQEPSFFPSFVFYASEWFRRRENEGAWSWGSVADSLESELRPTAHFYDGMDFGFSWWRRSVPEFRGRRQWLWAVVREGGLPVGRLAGEREHSLRGVLGALVEQAFLTGSNDLFPYAQRISKNLPLLLRDESILGVMCEFAWWLASNRAWLVSTADAEVLQDERLRGHLPFDLDTEAARHVALSLIAEGRHAAGRSLPAGVAERFVLEQVADGLWSIQRRLRLPRSTTAEALGLARALYCRLYLRSDSGQYASVADCVPADDRRVQILAPRLDFRCPPELGDGPVHLVAMSDGREVGRHSLPGGSDVPWVFLPAEAESETRRIGEGSMRRTAGTLLVAAPQGFTPRKGDKGEACRSLGAVGDRHLYAIDGLVTFERDGERCVVSARQAEDAALVVSLGDGPMLDGAFVGLPRLMYQDPGCRLFWRPDHLRAIPVEISLRSACTGEGWLSAQDEHGNVCFRRHLRLLPSTASVAPFSQLGAVGVAFSGFGKDASIAPLGSFQGQRCVVPNGVGFLGLPGLPGELVPFRIEWADGSSLVLRVATPGRSARFTLHDGTAVAAEVSLARLGRVVAEARLPDVKNPTVRVRAKLHLRPASPNVPREAHLSAQTEHSLQVADGHGGFRLPLITIKDELEVLFAATTAHEAYVELSFDGGVPRKSPKLRVNRYEGLLRPVEEGVELELPHDAAIAPAEVELRLQPFDRPHGPFESLVRVSGNRWNIDYGQRSGAWLVTGWKGDVCRFRPLRVTCRSAQDSPAPDGTLAAAIGIGEPGLRATALRFVFDRLEADWRDPEWAVVGEYLGSLHELPVGTFDVVAQMVHHWRICASALLRSAAAARPRIAQALEGLPFMWHLVPMGAWKAAVQARRAWMQWKRQCMEEPEQSLEEERLELEDLVAQLDSSLPGHPVIASSVRLAGEDLRILKGPAVVRRSFQEHYSTLWERFLRESGDAAVVLSVPGCPHPWPSHVRRAEASEMLEVPRDIEGLARVNAAVREVYRAPRLAAMFALTGIPPSAEQVVALRLAKGPPGSRSNYFEEVYRATMLERLQGEAINYWEKKP